MRISLFIVILSLSHSILAQTNIEEDVYVHTNSPSVITGETLYFSAYCRSASSGLPSKLSKYLYIELVGKEGAVYQDKWILNEGRGFGEFFVSSEIKTGRYNLLAYTRWMKNFGEYFSTEIQIINPFEEFPDHAVVEESLQVIPAHESVVDGIENTLGLRVLHNMSKRYKGRVVDEEGAVAGNFELDSHGVGLVKFIPQRNHRYEIILEDQFGKLSFYPMPARETSGYALQLSSSKDLITCKFLGTARLEEVYRLEIENDQGVLLSDRIELNSELSIPRSKLLNLEGAPIVISVSGTSGEQIVSRIVSFPSSSKPTKSTLVLRGTRTPYSLPLDLPEGSYSVSVRKKDALHSDGSKAVDYRWEANLSGPDEIDLSSYVDQSGDSMMEAIWLLTDRKVDNAPDRPAYLPEVREELLSGMLLSEGGDPVEDGLVAISLLQRPFQLRVTRSAQDGRFIMPFQSATQEVDAYLYPLDLDSGFHITLDSPYLSHYPDFNYDLQPPDSLQVVQIIEKSIRVQIENAYYKPRQVEDTSVPWLPQFRFDFDYNLDDYTRFKTLKETFTEYIVTANVRDKRKPLIRAYFLSSAATELHDPLILLDGVIVSPEKLIDFSPYEIESISVQNSRNFLGPLISDGVISFISKEGKLGGFFPGSSYVPLKIQGIARNPVENSPKYLTRSQHKLPDQRDQLYWMPALEVRDPDSSKIEFFTSDLSGAFRLIINGFDSLGKPLSRSIDIEVLEQN